MFYSSLQQWETAGLNEKLKLPPLNEFIPTNFDLVQREEEVSDNNYTLKMLHSVLTLFMTQDN